MVLAALAGSAAVWQHWRSCAGPQTFVDASGAAVGSPLGEACLRAMDDGFSFLYPDGKDPWRPESVAGLAFAVLLAASWTVVLLSQRWGRASRVVAVVPLVLLLLTAALNLLARSDALDSVFAHVQLALSASVVLAVVVLALGGTARPRERVLVALALCAPGAAGFLALAADYAVMATFSEANWDTPPWTGTLTLVATALAGVALVVLPVRAGRSVPVTA
ncbi:hypothetical protein SAMN05421756_11083 [Microlunatus flavus]|uniref:Uncharacterized protein n=2 Tax=Microlunatus flavus TaxID=1036181 RepID=A0A1H9MEB8_9ACTN|nr:hypothetical protein SAMN05421756_11083 [Microlunatus flavus]